MNIVLTQFYTSNVDYGTYSEKINEAYCNKYNYTYYVDKDDNSIFKGIEDRSPTWFKPKLILEVFEKFSPEYVLYLDIDAVIADFSTKIESFIDPNYNLIFSDDVGHHSAVNAGVFLIRNSEWSKDFLNEWWKAGATLYGKNGRDLIVREDLRELKGYYKTALWHDQTCLTYLYENNLEVKKNLKIISRKVFNHEEYEQGNFIFHGYAKGMYPFRTLDTVYNLFLENQKKLSITKKRVDKAVNKHSTDKVYLHNYFERGYNQIFSKFLEKCDILEVGIGEGSSLAIWKRLFEKGNVHGIDKLKIKNQKISRLEKDPRIKIINLDQSLEEDLVEFTKSGFTYDIIIDDGSHNIRDQQITFQRFFKLLKPGGYFILEDLHTSLPLPMYDKYKFKDKKTTLEVLHSIEEGRPTCDFITEDWEELLRSINFIQINREKEDSIYAIIKKK